MKKIMMICLFALMMSGCTRTNENAKVATSGNDKEIGVVQVIEHTSLNTIRDSFLKEMESLGYDANHIELKNAAGDENTLNSIAQKFANDGKDCVVAIATSTAQVAAKYSDKMPVIFSAVSDPIGAGLLTDMEHPNKNITGTSDEIQVDQILELAMQIQPNLKKIGVLYSSGEANSATYVATLEKLCEEKGIELTKTAIAAASDLQSAAQSLAPNVDAIFTPNDNAIASSMPVLVKAAKDANVPVYAGADSMVYDGAFATVGIDYEELGKETARMVDQVLKGTAIEDIPVKTFKDNLNVYINQKVLQELQITIPNDVQNNEYLVMVGEAQ